MIRKTLSFYTTLPLIFLLLAGGAACSREDAATKAAKKPVAKVNKAIITRAELDSEISRNLPPNAPGHKANTPQAKETEQYFLNRIVDQRLLLQQAESKKITVSAQEVDKRWGELIKRFPSQEVLNNFLKEKGFSEKQIKEDIQRGMKIEALLQQEVVSRVPVDDKQIREEFDSHREQYRTPEQAHARHIFFQLKADASPEEEATVRKKAEPVLRRVKKGEDFAALARQFSEDGSKSQGGDLGFFKRGDMVPAFEKAAFSLGVGKTSDLVRSPFGLHIIKVEGLRAPRDIPFEEIKDHVRENLTQQKTNKQFETYLGELRKTAKIEILLPK